MKQDANRSRTISLKTGIQNGPLAVLIVTLTFSGEMQQQVLLIPVLHSLFSVTTSSAITFFFRRMAERETLARDPALLDDRVKVYAAARHANPIVGLAPSAIGADARKFTSTHRQKRSRVKQ